MQGYGWWPMDGMMAGWLLLTAVLTGLVVWLVAAYARLGDLGDHAGTAQGFPAERFAQGELDADEYQQRLNALK